MTKREIKRRIIAALHAANDLADIPAGKMCNYFSPQVSGDVAYLFDRADKLRVSCVKARMIGKSRFKKLKLEA